MVKIYQGYCPAQKRLYSIRIAYIDSSDLSSRQFEKGTFFCEYASKFQCKSTETCPIYSKAENSI